MSLSDSFPASLGSLFPAPSALSSSAWFMAPSMLSSSSSLFSLPSWLDISDVEEISIKSSVVKFFCFLVSRWLAIDCNTAIMSVSAIESSTCSEKSQ